MIDIIIPIYNASKYLDKLLTSIYKQTYKDYYIYLVDANSTEEYNLSKYDNITYIKLEEQTPPGLTRQFGINNSNHEYILFIDQDDELLDDDSLEKLINNIDEYDVVSSGEYFEKENRNMINDISLHGKLYRRSFIVDNNIHFNEYPYHEDVYFNNSLFLKGARIKMVDKVTYYYHDNKESIVNTTEDIEIEKIEYLFKIIELLKSEIPIDDSNKSKYKELIFKNYDYFKRLFNMLDESEKNKFASYVKKYDIEDAPLMLVDSDIKLREKIEEIYK